jgi:hypothetical protein
MRLDALMHYGTVRDARADFRLRATIGRSWCGSLDRREFHPDDTEVVLGR